MLMLTKQTYPNSKKIRRPCLALAKAGRRPGPPLVWSFGFATVAAPSLLQTSEPPLQLPCTASSGCAILSSGCCPTVVSCGSETASIHEPFLQAVAAQSFLTVSKLPPAPLKTSKPPNLRSASIHEPLNPFLRFPSASLPPSTSSIGLATVAAPSLLQTSEPPLQLPCILPALDAQSFLRAVALQPFHTVARPPPSTSRSCKLWLHSPLLRFRNCRLPHSKPPNLQTSAAPPSAQSFLTVPICLSASLHIFDWLSHRCST